MKKMKKSQGVVPMRRLAGVAVAWVIVGALVTAAAPGAEAHRRNFAWTYEWWTPVTQEREIEVSNTFRSTSRKWKTALEYERGITDRWAAGLYGLLEREPGSHYKWRGMKLEQRYRFGDDDEKRPLHAAYLEVEKEAGDPWKVESKWITSLERGKDSFSFNLIAEKPLASGTDVEWGYALGWSRPRSEKSNWGLEAFGSLADNARYLGPGITWDVGPSGRLILNVGVGLNNRSEGYQARAIWEYEWFK